MQALLDVFDTNHDGKLDAGDADFSDFFVMETNANGTETVHSLASSASPRSISTPTPSTRRCRTARRSTARRVHLFERVDRNGGDGHFRL